MPGFAVATAIFHLNTHCGTILLLYEERDVHLMGKLALVHLLNFNMFMALKQGSKINCTYLR
jgi:hypothetical protein